VVKSGMLIWEDLRAGSHYTLRRSGRYIVAELAGEHVVLSTSARNGNCYLANHQSCEGTAHLARHDAIKDLGQEGYHDAVCAEMGLRPEDVALMGTAANMNYAAISTEEDRGVEVTAVVTAGVHGNAACAGDPAAWREGEAGWEKVGGTINTMVLINRPMTGAAMARAVMTMTEGKSAALQRLAVPSLYSSDLATGTGTDQFAIAAPAEGAFRLTSASPHVKLGEMIGMSVRDATLEALRWQNGMEPSYTRSIFTALGRYGLRQETFFSDIAGMLSAADLELMKKNSNPVFYEPMVAAGAYAFAAVMDRVRYQVLPESVRQEALRQQAASIAVGLSAKGHLWDWFRGEIREAEPVRMVLRGIALGWSAKWG
jgi:adenosylcobinamide amidohydrolase